LKTARSLLFAALLFLTACRSSVITDLTVQSGQELYHDNFYNPLSGWPKVKDENGSQGYDGGAYSIQILTAQYDRWAVPGQSFADAQVEADITRTAGPDQNRMGLICRYRDPQNFYFFVISSDQYFGLGKVSAGARILLGQDMMAYSGEIVPGAGPNHLRLSCFGQTLTAFVNGKIVAIATDADFTSGDVGLLAGTFDQPGLEAAFKNFVVYKP
jgi:hypothetical protein